MALGMSTADKFITKLEYTTACTRMTLVISTASTCVVQGKSTVLMIINMHDTKLFSSEEKKLAKSLYDDRRYLDTMSLHIALSGMTSSQRMFKEGLLIHLNSLVFL